MTGINFVELKNNLKEIITEVVDLGNFNRNDIFVLGCSTSEVRGGRIGKDSSEELGDIIIDTVLDTLKPLGIHLAVQGCEHINRALVIEKNIAIENRYEVVSVVPALHAGGACSLAAYKKFDNPVMVEYIKCKGGVDIGDTFIGMHVKHVQIPIRPSIKILGSAHITAVSSRPKLIGGERAKYNL